MYLSAIPVETGNDPNRIWPGKRWVSNPYRVHQRLCMAFDGKDEERILFRIDGPARTRRGLRPRVLVQSTQEPNWDAAFGNAPFLIVGGDLRVKPYDPAFAPGQVLRFRLRANPTKKQKAEGRKNGARVGLTTEEDRLAWLQRKAEQGGFALLRDSLTMVAEGRQYSRRSRQIDPNGHVHVHQAVLFDGLLRIEDGEAFRAALAGGIGPAKAYGFGLLSVAPV